MNLKAGIVAGLLTSIIIFVAMIIIRYSFTITEPSTIFQYLMVSIPFFNSIVGVIFWGFVYAYFYSRIPGSTSIRKSFVLGILPLIIRLIISGGADIYDTKALIEIVASYLIFGLFIGYFYDRFDKPRPNSTPSGSPVMQ